MNDMYLSLSRSPYIYIYIYIYNQIRLYIILSFSPFLSSSSEYPPRPDRDRLSSVASLI